METICKVIGIKYCDRLKVLHSQISILPCTTKEFQKGSWKGCPETIFYTPLHHNVATPPMASPADIFLSAQTQQWKQIPTSFFSEAKRVGEGQHSELWISVNGESAYSKARCHMQNTSNQRFRWQIHVWTSWSAQLQLKGIRLSGLTSLSWLSQSQNLVTCCHSCAYPIPLIPLDADSHN